MKKITFILSLLITSIGFSQEFPIDFEDPADSPWGAFNGAAAIVKDDGSGSNNVLELTSVGVDFDGAAKGLAVPVDLSDALNNTISITVDPQDALGATEERTHLLKFEGGVGGPAIAELFFTTVGPDEQTILVNFPSGLGTFATIVLFADSGAGNTDLGTYYFDDLTVVADPAPTCTDGVQNGSETGVDCGGTCPNACPQPPTTIIAAPARPVEDVLSILSPAYTDEAVSGVGTFAGATLANFTVETTDDTRELTTPTSGGGAQFQYFNGAGTGLDLSDFDTLHLDAWVLDAGESGSIIRIILQNFDPVSGAFQHNLETTIDINTPGVETWISVDINLADFSNPTLSKDNIQQVQVVAQGAAFGPTYFTNFYFYKSNDDCDNAEVIDSADFGTTISGTNVGASNSGLSDGCVTGNDVWYSFTAVQDGEVNVTVDSGFEYAFYSDCMGTLIGTCNSSLTTANTGTTYYLRIGDDGTTTRRAPGGFNFSISGSALSTDSFDLLNTLKIYPNPTNDSWNIEGANGTIDTVEVYDILGKRVQTLSPDASDVRIDASNLKTGLYLAKIYSGDAIKTIKLVKN